MRRGGTLYGRVNLCPHKLRGNISGGVKFPADIGPKVGSKVLKINLKRHFIFVSL